ncbi:hypothetical protein J437_LFUL015740 [Ladona fulva]|uniref:Putative rRNA methyltransferase n=1 Tax=Ladona fulva TaxID=123851 RepID=A0A8K0P6D7_LADFU|nr:hypothetical protein J437_LFUL015740 [Ladona fulva]
MGKKSKIGKQRKDKYYQLAKETGYRSRAAFKLIQLNRKFEFLQKSRVCIDLCAAPGGWMQVAKQNMPVSSIVVGIDLFPIKPIPGCISITEDITTNKCRTQLQKELKTWKADVVLNDGAPNVGKNWLHDAYQQSCLTLSALKVATEFLRPGGWFVTKIFRSKDYHPLIWVLKQLFKKVHSTKPQASRSESAEIFVVCQYYIAPHKLDNRFLDPKFVFEELDIGNEGPKINIFHPEKSKAKAIGYPEGSSSLHKSVTATDLILSEQGPLEILQYVTEVVIDDDKILNHPSTTAEIKECCKDIKVLGRKDLRNILNWCKSMKNVLREKEEKDEVEGNDKPETEIEEEDTEMKELEEDEKEIEEISGRIKELEEEERKEVRRKHKRMLKEQRKLREKMNLKMVIRGDEGPQLNENIDIKDSTFDLRLLKKSKELNVITDDTPDILAREEIERNRPKVVRFKDQEEYSTSLEKTLSGKENVDDESSEDSEEEKEGLGLTGTEDVKDSEDDDSPSSSSEEEEDNSGEVERPIGSRKSALITDLDARDKSQKRRQKADLWFQKSAFKDLEDDDDEDFEINAMKGKPKMQNGEQPVNGLKEEDGSSGDSDNSSSDDDAESDEEMQAEQVSQSKVTEASNKMKKRKLDAESLALGTLMVNSKKAKRDITDMAWNRYAFNDREGLPDWFLEDETKHMKKEVPVPKEMVEELKARERELNARPIKKVIEAKARKKKRAIRKLDKARKKVESLMENPEVTEREKAKQIKQLYKKATTTKKKEVKYIVAKKHTATKRGGRPQGLKGPYKVVDPRMKKDTRKLKVATKKNRRGGGKKPAQRAKKGKR